MAGEEDYSDNETLDEGRRPSRACDTCRTPNLKHPGPSGKNCKNKRLTDQELEEYKAPMKEEIRKEKQQEKDYLSMFAGFGEILKQQAQAQQAQAQQAQMLELLEKQQQMMAQAQAARTGGSCKGNRWPQQKTSGAAVKKN